ncbi:hypothetical protein GGF32_000863 [Allomyces javanicus]|nr:hypothetical protein GGF32_000863 [Allomyces javanicus]
MFAQAVASRGRRLAATVPAPAARSLLGIRTMTTNQTSRTTAKPIQDYTRYLTSVSLARQPSAIRALQPIMAMPGMISLAGGLPNPATFPIANVELTLKNGAKISMGDTMTRAALQYGPTPGHPDLVSFFEQLQARVHGTPYANESIDRKILVGNGSQDLLAKAINALVAPGDTLLVESPCYVGTLAILKPMVKAQGVKLAEVPTDAHGLIPDALDQILSGWPATTPKPRVLYTVPTGGNPTGNMAPIDRRRAIYALAQKHDLVMLEDDPYYYLQFALSPSDAATQQLTPPADQATDVALGDRYASALVPSYTSLDTDARVIRFESLSKVISAGLRVGLCTGPAPLVDRIALDIQATSLQPTGLSQAVILALAQHSWHGVPAGFLAHAARVAAFYRSRRDALLKAMSAVRLVEDGLVEMSVPQAGMFLWLKLKTVDDASALVKGYATDRKVLLLPGIEFLPNAQQGEPCAFVRATYSTATDEQMQEGMKRLRECIDLAMRDQQQKQQQKPAPKK